MKSGISHSFAALAGAVVVVAARDVVRARERGAEEVLQVGEALDAAVLVLYEPVELRVVLDGPLGVARLEVEVLLPMMMRLRGWPGASLRTLDRAESALLFDDFSQSEAEYGVNAVGL